VIEDPAAAEVSVDRIRARLLNQAPRANAIMERWIGSCRREILDRTLVWNLAGLRRFLAEYEDHTTGIGHIAHCIRPTRSRRSPSLRFLRSHRESDP
jgi:hypothetical protein